MIARYRAWRLRCAEEHLTDLRLFVADLEIIDGFAKDNPGVGAEIPARTMQRAKADLQRQQLRVDDLRAR